MIAGDLEPVAFSVENPYDGEEISIGLLPLSDFSRMDAVCRSDISAVLLIKHTHLTITPLTTTPLTATPATTIHLTTTQPRLPHTQPPPPPREQYNSSLITLSNASQTQLCITIDKTLFGDDHGPIIKYEIYVRQDQNNNELYPTNKARTYEEANQDYLGIILNEHTGRF
ncbi:unnamed protein product [Didymodactylos carnosus]|uniref:Uncharacterized protein n=1 Tax=Didymodactylos carnosus TaxID=1234261 RepID=A0A814VWE9_9BILA|nr:unnamed protein product [Didymodactylos carnosus]CAF3958863.1 unnamed protein product [Didymodactylos carnosus]